MGDAPYFDEKLLEEVIEVLENYKNAIPNVPPNKLPLRCEVNHKIELELRAKPPTKIPYYMTLMELEELQKLKDFLDAR